MDFLVEWLDALWGILVASGPYLLVGFVIAGFIKALIPQEAVFRHLGRDDFRSVAIASLVGVPIPLCSCSVIPTAIALKKSGASKGATSSFLISTPETGVDSIGVTWALMDPLMTIARPLAALFTALGCGAFVNWLVRAGKDGVAAGDPDPEAKNCCAEEKAPEPEPEPEKSCCAAEAAPRRRSPLEVGREAVRYAFGPLMQDLTPWFLVGFAVSGLITLLVPDNFFGEVLPPGWPSMLAMLVVGIPLYICATASTPVAAALVLKGLDPGAALVMLLAGPATNIATIAVVNNFLGKRVLAVYLASIAGFALALGWLVSFLYEAFAIDAQATVGVAHCEDPSVVDQTGGVILALLLAWNAALLLRKRFAPAAATPG